MRGKYVFGVGQVFSGVLMIIGAIHYGNTIQGIMFTMLGVLSAMFGLIAFTDPLEAWEVQRYARQKYAWIAIMIVVGGLAMGLASLTPRDEMRIGLGSIGLYVALHAVPFMLLKRDKNAPLAIPPWGDEED
ncbi:MAG: hypothetical protein FWB97_03060 [Oscillospiraceae bacterium]|nr:hypothetical protein [Oscillospiraceae bacterium]